MTDAYRRSRSRAALAEGEAIEFAREAVAQLFDRSRMRIVWDRTTGGR